MQESDVNYPCPMCNTHGELKMMAHVSEIPYFGEHTQVTLLCNSCGWRQTDFIPAEGKLASGWRLVLSSSEALRVRVVRSSSCTVRIPELDLEVNPGANSSGYVSNVEGVLDRFLNVINMVERDLANEAASLTTMQDLDAETLNQALEEVVDGMENWRP